MDLGPVEAGLRASPLGPALAGVPNGALFDTSSDVPILAIGNPYTEPESVDAVEFGYKGQFGRAFATADLHYSRFDAFETNLLPGVHPDFAPWTAPAVVPASAAGALADAANATVPGLTRLENGASAIVFSRVNAGEATQWGLDLSLGIRLSDEILVSGNYSYVTIDLDESSFLDQPRAPNTPEQIANFSSSWTRPDGLRLRAALHLVESFEFRDGVWEGGVPGRQTVDLDARGPLGDDLTLGISLVNAFDQSRFHYYGGSIIGRRLMASLVWSP